jgi:uncharacterized protein
MPLFVGLLVVLAGLSFTVDLYFDYLWFDELGKSTIFATTLYAKSTIGVIVLLAVFLFSYINLLIALRGPGSIQIGIPAPGGQITAYTFAEATLRRFAGIASLAFALLMAVRSSALWDTVWRWLNRVEFGKTDPIFGRDIGFFFFTLPVLEEFGRLALLLCLAVLAGCGALYYFKGSLTIRGIRGSGTRGRVGMHLSVLAAIVFLFLALDAFLDRFELLFGARGPLSGASYSDLSARLPLLSLLAATAIVGAVLWIVNCFGAGFRSGVLAVLLYVVVLLVGNIYPAIVQRFIVAPNEFGREAPQIVHNINATLAGFGLEAVQDRNLSGDKALSPADIQANAATIRSIRLWDHEPLLDAFSQIQEIRTYYDFTSVDNDRYVMNSEPQQMMLSPRELNSSSLPERNWINEHLSYTHGYGVTLGPVNRVTTEGLPVLLVQDIPPRTSQPLFKIERPEIYYGELTRGYVVVRTGAKEFDYPAGEENVYATYAGTGGVPIRSFLRKLLFAVYLKDANIVLSPLLKPESRVLYYRDVKTRLSRLAPYLQLDQDPYMVISGGRLFWIQDAYTTSDRYPYSTEVGGVGNYIRNSVKMVLDAYNGSVDMYVADPSDPVIQVYQRIFPGVFQPLSRVPDDLRRHLRYPEDIFRVQTAVYSVYHMNNPQVFYNKEDLWEIPTLQSGATETAMAPYYTIMRLPQEKREEFILMLPFRPGRKDNLSAWMVARSDGDLYGQLVVYRFPKQKLVYGPKQIVARINQDAEISRQISLWDQRGSQVIQGTLLVIPIEEGLLYVRPLYLRAEAGKIPELKRVIVAYENKIAMEETLETALARIFQTNVAPVSPASGPAAQQTVSSATPATAGADLDLLRQAREAYDRAIQAQRQGEWARYGEELKKLGAVLEQLSAKTLPAAERK